MRIRWEPLVSPQVPGTGWCRSLPSRTGWGSWWTPGRKDGWCSAWRSPQCLTDHPPHHQVEEGGNPEGRQKNQVRRGLKETRSRLLWCISAGCVWGRCEVQKQWRGIGNLKWWGMKEETIDFNRLHNIKFNVKFQNWETKREREKLFFSFC